MTDTMPEPTPDTEPTIEEGATEPDGGLPVGMPLTDDPGPDDDQDPGVDV